MRIMTTLFLATAVLALTGCPDRATALCAPCDPCAAPPPQIAAVGAVP